MVTDTMGMIAVAVFTLGLVVVIRCGWAGEQARAEMGRLAARRDLPAVALDDPGLVRLWRRRGWLETLVWTAWWCCVLAMVALTRPDHGGVSPVVGVGGLVAGLVLQLTHMASAVSLASSDLPGGVDERGPVPWRGYLYPWTRRAMVLGGVVASLVLLVATTFLVIGSRAPWSWGALVVQVLGLGICWGTCAPPFASCVPASSRRIPSPGSGARPCARPWCRTWHSA